MPETIQVGDRVKVYFDSKFGDKEGWYEGVAFKIDPYSTHRSFYWVEMDEGAQTFLGVKHISVFNPRNIQRL